MTGISPWLGSGLLIIEFILYLDEPLYVMSTIVTIFLDNFWPF